MARCFECKKNFCFDHIFCGMITKEMGQNEEIRDVCDECKRKLNYFSIDDLH